MVKILSSYFLSVSFQQRLNLQRYDMGCAASAETQHVQSSPGATLPSATLPSSETAPRSPVDREGRVSHCASNFDDCHQLASPTLKDPSHDCSFDAFSSIVADPSPPMECCAMARFHPLFPSRMPSIACSLHPGESFTERDVADARLHPLDDDASAFVHCGDIRENTSLSSSGVALSHAS